VTAPTIEARGLRKSFGDVEVLTGADLEVGRSEVFALPGSYARGEATEDSDLDFHIIDRGALRGLFRLSGFNIALKEKLKMNVDVVTSGSLSEDFLNRIRDEEVVVYEA
jgi:predicted nucleotidyltransferase